MSNSKRSDDEVRETGFAALRKLLGTEDGLRFLRLYTGDGSDHTRERDFILGGSSIDEIVRQIEETAHETDTTPGRSCLIAPA